MVSPLAIIGSHSFFCSAEPPLFKAVAAKIAVETKGEARIDLPGGAKRARELVLYPDLNDFVRVGGTVARLAKPLMPHYHLWFELEAPNRIVRFEGPYGPPGAPELIMELVE